MQGRFKRDGSAPAGPEPRGGTGANTVSSSPQHAQNPGSPTQAGDGKSRPGGGPTAPLTPTAVPPIPPVKAAKGDTGNRVALRNWRISTRLVALLTLPVVAATTLGALRINQSMEDIQQLDNMRLLTDMTKQATELSIALQNERDRSAGPLAHGGGANDITVKGLRATTDRSLDSFVNASEEIDATSRNGNLQGVRDNLVGLVGDLGNLAKLRSTAYTASGNSMQTVEGYHRLISRLVDLSQDMAEATSNPEMIQRTRALAAFSSAKEYSSIQRAVLTAALPTNSTTFGDLSDNDRNYGETAVEGEDSELAIFRSIYGSEGAESLLKPIESGNATIKEADEYAGRAFASKSGLESQDKRSYQDWLDASGTKLQQMKNIESQLLEDMEQKARELRNETERDAIISGVLILLVLGVSLVGAFVVARSMIRSLRRLQETATKVAQERLPELVKQLSESDPQDVDTSVESVGVHSRDEIGQVAAAFDDVHREAVRLAAEQALLRGNVNAMFTNLSRRSQGLIQRQLSLISELESREADPDQLSSLFKLDHLATRMRRNGENLLVLAGEEPGRRWTRPVPLVDVLRAAASEVEQYERIELASVPTTEVAGRVVNDLVHLLAELLENATSFSSPQTKVKVTGHALPDGRVLIEIHDTGIGLSPEDLAAINERLASPPTVDVSVSRRMGLFVVGRLSQRHGIRIQLRPSDSGGTTALVMLPVDVAQGGKKPQPKPGQGGAPAGGPAAAQAAAGAAAARRQSGQGGQGGPQAPGAFGSGPAGVGAPGKGGNFGSGPGGSGSGGAFGDSGAFGGSGAFGAGPAGNGNGNGGFGAGPGGGALGGGPRTALPGRDGAPARGQQQGGRPSAPAPAGTGAFNGLQAAPPQGQDMFGGGTRPPRGKDGQGEQGRGRQPQLPARGGPRAELPGGNPPPRTPSWGDDSARTPALDAPRGHDEPEVARTSQMPRVEGPGSTAEIPRIDADFGRPGTGQAPNSGQQTGQFPALGAPQPQSPSQGNGNRRGVQDDFQATSQFPALGAPQQGDGQGQFGRPGHNPLDNGGQFQRPDVFGTGQQPTAPQSNAQQSGAPQHSTPSQHSTPQAGAPRQGYDGSSTGQHALPGARANGYSARPEPEALPPAGPGDGRTPLYDTLETNWFHQQGGQVQGAQGVPQQPQAQAPAPAATPASAPSAPTSSSAPSAPQRPAASPASSSWRSTPNDELVRQAERVRQPASGGITTSGLPRRVPRANLVPGTAQQQQHQTGPQVSRAPDDVRGRLTNLRRGIAQGRQAGSGQTDSFPSPTHQQER
ncbi:nitrate- and nitrite sensing domain-containing protein [Streptomyces roseirectus]|uniref:histidine kinase n=1 Tax=Streptomyces roseirectus TaxID=2768066 RepID=A0A7H0IB14_9ACTN|nr:nitrate- and nitrite sensing domain-containing protein [Streptomyces roseirectus]QNP69980.1 nitrate- and nitrite sensing domain-containing protein [Streptomyces roseirectus]